MLDNMCFADFYFYIYFCRFSITRYFDLSCLCAVVLCSLYIKSKTESSVNQLTNLWKSQLHQVTLKVFVNQMSMLANGHQDAN